jgi:hypothetical protein
VAPQVEPGPKDEGSNRDQDADDSHHECPVAGATGAAALSTVAHAGRLAVRRLADGRASRPALRRPRRLKRRAILSPLLKEIGIPFHGELPQSEAAVHAGGAPVAVISADELAKPAQLRDQGVLTGEEFVTPKTRLLRQTVSIARAQLIAHGQEAIIGIGATRRNPSPQLSPSSAAGVLRPTA